MHPMTGARIAVVGSFMQAQCWQAQRLPVAGESLAASAFWAAPAGKGLAVAMGCARLGATVDLFLAIGDDPAGDALLQRLSEEGLHTRHVQRHAGPSGQGAGWLSADGCNAILTFAGANARLGAAQIAQAGDVWAQASVAYAQFESPQDAAQEAFARADSGGACTILNPSPWQPPEAPLLAHTQVLLVNEGEARQLLSLPGTLPAPTDAAAWRRACAPLWSAWPGDSRRRLVVTLGGQGCLALAPDGCCLSVPAPQVQVRDSIGAGDAFAAGLCTAWAEGRSLPEALRRANACGAFAVQRSGILEGLPHAAELASWDHGGAMHAADGLAPPTPQDTPGSITPAVQASRSR